MSRHASVLGRARVAYAVVVRWHFTYVQRRRAGTLPDHTWRASRAVMMYAERTLVEAEEVYYRCERSRHAVCKD